MSDMRVPSSWALLAHRSVSDDVRANGTLEIRNTAKRAK
eukprot:CAMPEP_0194547166 /NCGR_PEP_ID=MMETSP0253-20130528/91752_1 /TAXON_ID=2966 /ORGANISM="Noctiluca scintillans" /LENGTH=38 /DNA_ID= /DNA_START= /DNA_END= /DNA_ORIENTATION=